MNITKLNHRIDDIEDEIYREKLKIKRTADELNDTFDDMMNHYQPFKKFKEKNGLCKIYRSKYEINNYDY